MIRIPSVFIVTGWMLLGATTPLLMPSAARADCLGFWDLSGSWAITQHNGFIAHFALTQTGKSISGTAECCDRRERCASTPGGTLFGCSFQPTMQGDVVGNVDGDEFTMTAHWNGTAGGEYKGNISERGIEGGTRDLNNPGAEAALWYGDHPATPCTVKTPPSQAEPPDKPVKVLGKIKITVTDLGNGEVEYTYPTVKTSSGAELPLDWCRVWANDCGKGAADAFCRQAGHQAAARFARFDGMRKTWVIDDHKECNAPCASFKSIVCTKVTVSSGGGGAEYATAVTPATLYVKPGGDALKDAEGNDIGIPVGSKWLVLEKRTNPVWYRLQTKPVGWVWGDDVTLGP